MVKNLPASSGDLGSIPGSGRSPGEGNGNLLQYSYLGNPMDRGAGGLQSTGSQRVRQDLVTGDPYLSPCCPWASASARGCLGSRILCPQHQRTNQNVFVTRSQVIDIHVDKRGTAVGQGPWNVNVPEPPGGPVKPLAGFPPGFTSGRSGVGPENVHPSWGLLSASLGTSLEEPRVSPGAGTVCLLP